MLVVLQVVKVGVFAADMKFWPTPESLASPTNVKKQLAWSTLVAKWLLLNMPYNQCVLGLNPALYAIYFQMEAKMPKIIILKKNTSIYHNKNAHRASITHLPLTTKYRYNNLPITHELKQLFLLNK